MPDDPQFALLISVGGTPEPVAYSINHYRPEKIVFFASLSSRSEIETRIRPITEHTWKDQEIITTPDHQDLTRCIQSLSTQLPQCLENL